MVQNVTSCVAPANVLIHTTFRVLLLLENVLLDVWRGGNEMTVKQVYSCTVF